MLTNAPNAHFAFTDLVRVTLTIAAPTNSAQIHEINAFSTNKSHKKINQQKYKTWINTRLDEKNQYLFQST